MVHIYAMDSFPAYPTYYAINKQYVTKFHYYVIIRYRQIFSGGVSDQNENLVGRKWKIGRKIFRAPLARKKRGSQIFRLRRAFFVVEALKTAKKPLKTAKNR